MVLARAKRAPFFFYCYHVWTWWRVRWINLPIRNLVRVWTGTWSCAVRETRLVKPRRSAMRVVREEREWTFCSRCIRTDYIVTERYEVTDVWTQRTTSNDNEAMWVVAKIYVIQSRLVRSLGILRDVHFAGDSKFCTGRRLKKLVDIEDWYLSNNKITLQKCWLDLYNIIV